MRILNAVQRFVDFSLPYAIAGVAVLASWLFLDWFSRDYWHGAPAPDGTRSRLEMTVSWDEIDWSVMFPSDEEDVAAWVKPVEPATPSQDCDPPAHRSDRGLTER